MGSERDISPAILMLPILYITHSTRDSLIDQTKFGAKSLIDTDGDPVPKRLFREWV
jgi:hypothetical protein